MWNVTGSGGTNLQCLAHYPADEQWKCLLAPFILEHIQACRALERHCMSGARVELGAFIPEHTQATACRLAADCELAVGWL